MATNGTGVAPANYLWGDPARPESILGGRLECDSGGLRFRSPAGTELLLGIDSLRGMSISGRTAARGQGRRPIRGTMRVAGLIEGEPTEWVFAIDRSAAAGIQAQLNHALASRGRAALPHIEELVGFPSNGRGPTQLPQELISPPPLDRVAAELGHRLDAADRRPSRRRVLPWIALGAVLVALEVIVPLILLRGG